MYKYKIPLLIFIHHFKSDLIKNMDHMLISGTEPSSVNSLHISTPLIHDKHGTSLSNFK